MRVHLSEESTIDALHGEAPPDVRRHLESCPECGRRVALAREALALAADAEVPEPPPLYWETFRRQVGRRVAEEPRRGWLPWLVPVLAAAAALLVATTFHGRLAPAAPSPSAVASLPPWSALPPAEDDAGLAVLKAFEMTDGSLEAALPVESVEGTLADLSDDESADLADALRQELGTLEAS
ncbi:MAG: hypothetical protein ABW221_03705 [Vicinamibacteria bacterium]